MASVSRSTRSARPARRRAPTLPRAERRASILAGATTAFASGGFGATSMDDIAAACGITTIIVYRHFASKEELYREVLAGAASRHSAALADPASPAGIDAAALLSVARGDPDGFRLLWRHAVREPRFSSHVEAIRERAVGAVRAGLAERVEPGFLDWAAHASVSYAIAAVLDWLDYGDPGNDRRFLTATRQALRAGVRAWSSAGLSR